jgi:hypothetical protein
MEDKDFEFDANENEFGAEEVEAPETEEQIELGYVQILDEPIKLTANKTIEQLVYNNGLTGKMVAHLPVHPDQYKLGHFFPAIAGMTGETMQAINKLGIADLNRAIEIVTSFFKSGRQTG